MQSELEQRIIAWWNDNAFLGYLVESLQEISEIMDYQFVNNYYSSVNHMIKYHQRETEMDIDYIEEFKQTTGLLYVSQLDDILLNPETITNYYFEDGKFIYYKEKE